MHNRFYILKAARQFFHLIVLTCIVFLFWQIGAAYQSSAVQEYGIFESTQSAVLLLITISFGIQSITNKNFRPILISLSMLSLAALVREYDSYLDGAIPYIGWTWCWIFPIIGITVLIRRWDEVCRVLPQFLQSNTFQMMVTALIIIIPVAQCLGHRSFLVDLLGNTEADSHLVRRIMEEPIELLGYIQILLASLESCIELRKK